MGDVGDDGQPRRDADTEVAGCPIPAGSPVSVLTGSANRDEARWDDADEWRLGRPAQHHLAFGTGPHQCLGMHLARLELRAGLDAILDRLAEPAPRSRRRPRRRDHRGLRLPRPALAPRRLRRDRLGRSVLQVDRDRQRLVTPRFEVVGTAVLLEHESRAVGSSSVPSMTRGRSPSSARRRSRRCSSDSRPGSAPNRCARARPRGCRSCRPRVPPRTRSRSGAACRSPAPSSSRSRTRARRAPGVSMHPPAGVDRQALVDTRGNDLGETAGPFEAVAREQRPGTRHEQFGESEPERDDRVRVSRRPVAARRPRRAVLRCRCGSSACPAVARRSRRGRPWSGARGGAGRRRGGAGAPRAARG